MSLRDIPSLFVSYATPDRERVDAYYQWLKSEGYVVWMDCHQLLPGQNWDFEIATAIDKATFVLVFLSEKSVIRRSYVQRELKVALDRAKERLSDDVYIIPILLDDVPLPTELKGIHCISAGDPDHRVKIKQAINWQLERVGLQLQSLQSQHEVSWNTSLREEEWDGLPGYKLRLELLDIESARFPQIKDAAEIVRGAILDEASDQRDSKLYQEPDRLSFGTEKSFRTNEFEASVGQPCLTGRVLTIQYAIHWYGAGAAHPNYAFRTFSFLLDPLIRIRQLGQIFEQPKEALLEVQRIVRRQLLEGESEGVQNDSLDADYVRRGTETWESFGAFVFEADRINLLFAPYHVAPYACGPQFAKLMYSDIEPLLKSAFLDALDVSHVRFRRTRLTRRP